MKAWLWHHADSLRASLARLARAPIATLLTVGVIGAALALPAGLYLVVANLQRGADALAPVSELTLFLTVDAPATETGRIEARLKAHPGVQRWRFVPRAEALADLKARTGLADVVESLAQNPLPDAFIVEPRDTRPESMDALSAELAKWPSVAHVQHDSVWARRLAAGLRVGRLAAALLATLFAVAFIAVTFNTIRLQMLTRREEIEVARLMGATAAFVRRPFLYFGALQGLAGGLAAWAFLQAGVWVVNDGLLELGRLYGTRLALTPLAPVETAVLLGTAAGLGWLGSWLSVASHLGQIKTR